MTDTRYYGLVHYLNKAQCAEHPVLYEVTNNWNKFGMGEPFYFDPEPGLTEEFGDAHVLISTDPPPQSGLPGTTNWESHTSVIKDFYRTLKEGEDAEYECTHYPS